MIVKFMQKSNLKRKLPCFYPLLNLMFNCCQFYLFLKIEWYSDWRLDIPVFNDGSCFGSTEQVKVATCPSSQVTSLMWLVKVGGPNFSSTSWFPKFMEALANSKLLMLSKAPGFWASPDSQGFSAGSQVNTQGQNRVKGQWTVDNLAICLYSLPDSIREIMLFESYFAPVQ